MRSRDRFAAACARRVLLALLVGVVAGCDDGSAQRQAAEAAAVRAETEAAALLQHLDEAAANDRPDLARAFAEDLVTRFPQTAAGQAVTPRLPALREAADAELAARRLRELWTYHEVPEPETGGTVRTGYIYAVAGGPGEPEVRLVLRRHPGWGQSAYLLITGGDFACQGKCQMQMIADGGEPVRMVISRAENNVPPAVFIDDDPTFLKLMLEARQLELRVALAPSREASYAFEVAGFDLQRLGPATGAASEAKARGMTAEPPAD
jgi:hypothetical protein